MKKLFTLMVMCVLAIAAQAKITIYVQCETAPYLWTWGAAGGTFDNVGDWPGTLQMTDKYTHPDTGEEFWMYSFPEEITQISFLLNNGEATGTIQTDNVEDVISDRYLTLSWTDLLPNGHATLVDVTEDYTEIPDVEITSLGVSGSFLDWDTPANVYAEVVEAGKTFKYTIDPSTIEAKTITFKFRPNGVSWMNFWDIYYDTDPVEGKAPKTDAPEWLEYTDDNDANFKIDFKKYTATAFTFTMTFNGGKSASTNWTLVAEATDLQKLDPSASESTWTVAGDAALCGENWAPAYTANDMTLDATDGLYKLTRSDVALEAGDYMYKVVADHDWSESYGGDGPDGNQVLTIDAAGTYDVTFTFNAESKEVGAQAVLATSINVVELHQQNSAAIYNLQGQRVNGTFRGIAIQNGKKVVLK